MANQAEERAKAIVRIRKLRNQTVGRGRTEGEASMAMEKMAELMEVYDLTMNDVVASELEYVQEHIALGSTKTNFMSNVIVRLSEFCGVLVWQGQEPGTSSQWTRGGKRRRMMAYFFFGAKEDVEMALYLYDVIESAINTETAKHKKSLGKGHARGFLRTAAHGFQQGMCGRINQQLIEKTDERAERANAAFETTGTDIVMIKGDELNKKRKQLGLRTVYRQHRSGDYASRAAGSKAGSNFNLNRPINQGAGGQKLLS